MVMDGLEERSEWFETPLAQDHLMISLSSINPTLYSVMFLDAICNEYPLAKFKILMKRIIYGIHNLFVSQLIWRKFQIP